MLEGDGNISDEFVGVGGADEIGMAPSQAGRHKRRDLETTFVVGHREGSGDGEGVGEPESLVVQR